MMFNWGAIGEGVAAGFTAAQGIGKLITARQQKKEAKKERQREAEARLRRDGMLRESQTEARQRSQGVMPGYSDQKELLARNAATTLNTIRKGSSSGANILAAASAVNQNMNRASQGLTMENARWKDRTLGDVWNLQNVGIQFANRDMMDFGDRAQRLANASIQNKLNSFDDFSQSAQMAGNSVSNFFGMGGGGGGGMGGMMGGGASQSASGYGKSTTMRYTPQYGPGAYGGSMYG